MTAYRTAYGASARPRAEYVTGAWVEPEAVLAGKAPDGRARRGSGRSSAGHWPASSGASRARAGAGAGPQSEGHDLQALTSRAAPEEVAAGPAADPLAGRPGVALDPGRPDGDGPRLGDRLASDRRYQRLARYRLAGAGWRRASSSSSAGSRSTPWCCPRWGCTRPGRTPCTNYSTASPAPGVPTARRTSPRLRGPRGPASRCRRRTTRTPDSLRTTWAGRGVSPVTSIGDVPPAVVAAEANPSLPALPPTAKIEKVSHQWQTWNNCGPATITMAVSVFGRAQDQTAAMNFMKTTPNDKNVRPDNKLVAYARSLGLQAIGGRGRAEPAEAVPGQRDPGGGGGELPPRAQRLDGALPAAGGLRRRAGASPPTTA